MPAQVPKTRFQEALLTSPSPSPQPTNTKVSRPTTSQMLSRAFLCPSPYNTSHRKNKYISHMRANDLFTTCHAAINQNEPILNFFVQEETFKRADGLGLYPTIETERNDTLFLRRMFGDAITMKEEVFGGGRTTTRNHNPYGRTMRVPF
jgi:hypothetical protein